VSEWVLIEGGDVFDADHPEWKKATNVLVEGTRIAAVGPTATADAVPRGESLGIIDARGRTVLPGLIDAHCHLTYGDSRTQEEQDLYTGVEARTLRTAYNARRVLRSGVTSISQPGGSYYIGIAVRDAIAAGMVVGPRMTSAGRYLSTSNSLTDYYPDHGTKPDGGVGVLTNTIHEMTNEIRHQVKNGVDLIKLADSPYGQYQAFTNEELKRVTDLVHQLKKKVTIHARGSAEVDASIDAGVDWIMHGNVMTDDVIEKLAASKIPLVPTLLLLGNFADYGDLVGAPRGQRDGCRRMLEKTAPTLHKAHEAGVTFVMGTDAGFSVTPYGEWHARELALLMQYAGLSAHEAILAGTVNAAPMVGLEGRVGEIAPGYLADVIVVDGDPLADINVLVDRRRITHVLKGGQEVDLHETLDWWPHERAQVFSVADLTYDYVFGEGGVRDESLPWREEEARDLLHDMEGASSTARIAGY